MKFFSNEKESETEPQADPDRTQPVSTQPVTVPPQRAGSPWSDAPRDPADKSDVAFQPENPDRSTSGTASDTASGTASGTASDTADGEPVDRERRGVVEEQAVSTTTYGPDGTVVEDTDYRATHTGDAADRPRDDSPVDLPLTDDTAIKDEGTFDSPRAVDPATGDKFDTPQDAAVKDDGTFDSPQAVDPATGDTLDSDNQRASDTPATPAAPVAEAAAVPVAAPAAAAAPKPAADSGPAKLLPDGDSFAERFRDIQLRFVDEPKEATAEAAALVGDAVDKLTSALKAQRDGLAGNSDDTEKLRVELRAYREILNRLLAL
ncbi:hypothetical protein [Paractinoplanes maris]|uniref:hypothetical protein n=1 Tax=Paractinoplanes maris TaxID=1734446 RepID=UPI00202104F7|nr:hypothetical protein [Actinoplanes maris]